MARTKESKRRTITKGILKTLGFACVDGAAAGVVAAVVPLAMINPIIGGIIVAGTTITTMAACDAVVDKYVDKKIDECSDEYHKKVDPIVESLKLIKKAKEIFTEKGEEETRKFMKDNGFDKEQIEETIKQFKKKS